ncbi:Glycosyltransferase Family 1 protein [Gigaspora rosea]|uniref:Glycosyltransferase Family 1 protein n=1 Tax=Gigaspora rosea TaxID=44941 RepID=A0A397U556_9GLOM|nr:Glycosyltransferase Family 1 protein [Gigaspora rosea]
MYNAKPMLVLPIRGDQPRNAEMLELAGMALKTSKTDLKLDDIITKVKRSLNEEGFKKNAERLQFLAKVNRKRKYRAADLIVIVLNTAKYEGVKEVNGGFKVDNENLLRDWITPDTRMGFIRGNNLDVNGGYKVDNENLLRDWITPDTRMGYIRGNNLDVYGTAIILFLALIGGFFLLFVENI